MGSAEERELARVEAEVEAQRARAERLLETLRLAQGRADRYEAVLKDMHALHGRIENLEKQLHTIRRASRSAIDLAVEEATLAQTELKQYTEAPTLDTLQSVHDAGINPFAVELLVKSMTRVPPPPERRIRIRAGGVGIDLVWEQETSKKSGG